MPSVACLTSSCIVWKTDVGRGNWTAACSEMCVCVQDQICSQGETLHIYMQPCSVRLFFICLINVSSTLWMPAHQGHTFCCVIACHDFCLKRHCGLLCLLFLVHNHHPLPLVHPRANGGRHLMSAWLRAIWHYWKTEVFLPQKLWLSAIQLKMTGHLCVVVGTN